MSRAVDGSEQCFKRLLDKMESIQKTVEMNATAAAEYRQDMRALVNRIEDHVEQHQHDVDVKFTKMNERVDHVDTALESVLTDRAKITGAVKALSLLWAVLAGIVAFAPGLVRDVVNGALNK